MPEWNDTNPENAAEIDAALAARLERLNARRAPAAPRSTTQAQAGRPTGEPTYASPSGPTPKRKRRHAAAGARQAALALSLVTTGGLSYAMSLAPTAASASGQPAGVVTGAATSLASNSTAGSTSTSAPSSTSSDAATAGATDSVAPAATPDPSASATAAPVVVNGGAYSNRFGVVQVQATFATDGTITSVTTLQTPDGDRQSVSINDRAVPTLNAEALNVQSANVDTVSGATYTSNDYRRSLQSAIDAARASGLVAA